MSTKLAAKLSPEHLQAMNEAAREATLYQRKVQRELDSRLLEDLKKMGVQVYTFPPEERDKFVKAVGSVWKKYEAEVGGKSKIDAILNTK